MPVSEAPDGGLALDFIHPGRSVLSLYQPPGAARVTRINSALNQSTYRALPPGKLLKYLRQQVLSSLVMQPWMAA